MSSELVVTYSSLGTKDVDDYYKGEECHACVKDLIRAIRSDDQVCNIRRALGKARVLQTDLIPLLIYHHDDIPLRNDVIKLLVNLTQPAGLCFNDARERKDSEFMKSYLEVVDYLQSYKEEFTDTSMMNVLGTVLADLCQKEWDDRDDDDLIVIERILLLIRNILHITSNPIKEKRTDDDVSIHDLIVLNLHKNGIDDLLLFLGSNVNETEWCMHVLEIFFLLLKEQSPYILVNCDNHTHEEREKEEQKIEEILLKENAQSSKSKVLAGARHSRFGGSFYVMPQLVGRTRVHHKPIAGVHEYSYDAEKKPRRTPKQKKAAVPPVKPRYSTYSIRMILKKFCIQVLDCCFNPLMKVVKDQIKHHKTMENDPSYYLWAIKFFMEFSRLFNFRVDIVSETLGLSTLRDIISLINEYYEQMFMNKRDRIEALNWSQRLHYAVNAYKELLLHIKTMTQSADPAVVESSKVILGNILYHSEYRDMFVTLLRNYKQPLQPIVFLQDVILMTHVYIHLMDRYCRKTGNVVIQKKRKVKTKKHPSSNEFGEIMAEDSKFSHWEKIKELVITCVSDRSDTIPCVVSEEMPLDEQRLQVMGKIYGFLCQSAISSAVSIMRNAREKWPDDVFGCDGASNEDDVQHIHDIFFNSSSATIANRISEDAALADVEDYEEEFAVREYELEFDFNKLTSMFVNNKIVSAYCLALKSYEANSEELNHAIIKVLHIVATKHKMSPMLYHVSFFKTLLLILQEPKIPRFKEIQEFSRFVVNEFFCMCQTNPVAFVELLFWKTSSECYELSEGYGTIARQREITRNRTVFSREQEEELAELFEKFKNEDDIVGCIHAALPPELQRSRNIIASQIVSQGLVSTRKDLNVIRKKTKKKVWTEEEIYTLRSLWEPDQDVKDSIKQLLHYFPEHGIQSIKRQLYSLGLIKSRNRKKANGIDNINDDINDDDINDDIDDGDTNDDVLLNEGVVESIVHKPALISGSKGDVDCIVQRLIRKGHSNELAWLSEYLTNEAEDREIDDEWEDICLVPQQENQSLAIELQLFKDLLVSIGLEFPGNQVYWRIPKTLTPEHLKSSARRLVPTDVSEDNFDFSGDEMQSDTEGNPDEFSQVKSKQELLLELQQNRKNPRKRRSEEQSSQSYLKKQKKHFVSDDSDIDDDQNRLVIADCEQGNTEQLHDKKQRKHFESDDSDIDDYENRLIITSNDNSQCDRQENKLIHRRLFDEDSSDEN